MFTYVNQIDIVIVISLRVLYQNMISHNDVDKDFMFKVDSYYDMVHKSSNEGRDKIRFTSNLNHKHRGLLFIFNFAEIAESLENKLSKDLLDFINNRPIINYSIEDILIGTVEGQEFLELVISEYTDWDDKCLNLEPPEKVNNKSVKYIKDYLIEYKIDNTEGSRWESEEDDLDKYVNSLKPIGKEEFGIAINADVKYVIRLIDEDWRHWLYVGQSTRLYNQLRKHINNGGEFAEANRRRMEVIKIEELRTDVSKEELYNEVIDSYDVDSECVCGVY